MTQRRSRLFLYGPILFLGVMLLAWRIMWSAGADEMRETLRRAADRLAQLGVVMTYDRLETEGFPFSLKGHTENVAFSGPRRRIFAHDLNAEVSLLHFDRLKLSTDRIEIAGDGEFWTVDGDLQGLIGRDVVHGWTARTNARDIVAARGDLVWRIDAVRIESAPDENAFERIVAVMVLDNLTLVDADAKIDRIEATIGIEAAGPIDEQGAAPPRELTLRGMKMQFDGATLIGSGVVRILPGGDTEGVADACIDKPVMLAKLAAEASALDAADEAKAAAALAFASRLSKDGSLCAPVAMRDGAISIAGVPFAKY
jgi:hypothetical protein